MRAQQKTKQRKQEKYFQTKYYHDEPFYGMSDTCSGQIEVNVEFIWKLCKNDEDKFIRLFSLTYMHEYIHTVVSNIVQELYTCGEEKFIRKILGEEWDKEMETYYACVVPPKMVVIKKGAKQIQKKKKQKIKK